MKLADDIRAKFGDDKLLHFFIFAFVVAVFTNINIYAGLISFGVMALLSVIKELFLDDSFIVKDLIAGVLGGLVSLIIKIILNYL